jgi:exodeoxyribonuclease-5
MEIREGKRLRYGDYGAVRVVSKGELGESAVMGADQVLCGLNRTRHAYNKFIRLRKGIEEGHPIEGERLVCLKNNRAKGFFNGGIYTVKEVRKVTSEGVTMHVAPEDAGRSRTDVEIEIHPFFLEGREDELPWEVRRDYDEFTFGYVLTVHKSQGSQWDDVVLYDQSGAFKDDRRRHLYTGVTRAAKTLTVVM